MMGSGVRILMGYSVQEKKGKNGDRKKVNKASQRCKTSGREKIRNREERRQ